MILLLTSVPADGCPIMPGDCAIDSDHIRAVILDRVMFRGVLAPIAYVCTADGRFQVFDTDVIDRWARANGEMVDKEDVDWIQRKLG